MRCPNCGQRLADEARKCPVCGTVIDEVVRMNIPEKQAEETKISYAGEDVSGQSSGTEEHHSFETENINAKQYFPAMPMKWYKFLIYFSLILTGLSNMYTGVQAVMGMQYGTKDQSAQVYAVYPGLHILDIVYGVLLIILGVFVSLRGIKNMLVKHRSKTIYAIIGMMIGSLYAIVIGPTTLEVPREPMSFNEFYIGYFIIGVIFVLGLEKLKQLPWYKKVS